MFLERWSPRALTGEPLAAADLLTMLAAARWAPTSYDSQPWRFAYARRDTPHRDRFLDLLVPCRLSDRSAELRRPVCTRTDHPQHAPRTPAGTLVGLAVRDVRAGDRRVRLCGRSA